MIQKTKLKKIFHDHNVQINIEAINILDDHVRREVILWARRCNYGNVKRLTPYLIWVALGKITELKDKDGKVFAIKKRSTK